MLWHPLSGSTIVEKTLFMVWFGLVWLTYFDYAEECPF